MLVYKPAAMEKLIASIFKAAGAPCDVAEHVAHSLVESNLRGHDSHGLIRILQYMESVEKGAILPAARPSIAKETPTTAVVDGAWSFGQIAAEYATTIAIEKARSNHVAAVSITRLNHIGRLGEYTELAARHGMFAFMTGAVQRDGPVAPYGAASGILGTNPIAFSFPAERDNPVVVDMATSVAAEGKLRVARAKGQRVEPGTIIDKDGNPTTDPNDFYDGGALLTFGGHKGYSLSMVAEMIGRYTAGGEKAQAKDISFGAFLTVVNLEAFRPVEEFQRAVAARASEIKGVKLSEGFSEILLPGEPESRTKSTRLVEGIPVPEDTVARIAEVAGKLGVAMPEPVA
jgi:LDH2 family malate/lactate/ureidoglycolate dehydrogenase